MNIDNQKDYWDSVAQQKTFTHPVNTDLLLHYADKDAAIIDYGCGYGRVVSDLLGLGFTNIAGYDTSVKLINPGANSISRFIISALLLTCHWMTAAWIAFFCLQ